MRELVRERWPSTRSNSGEKTDSLEVSMVYEAGWVGGLGVKREEGKGGKEE